MHSSPRSWYEWAAAAIRSSPDALRCQWNDMYQARDVHDSCYSNQLSRSTAYNVQQCYGYNTTGTSPRPPPKRWVPSTPQTRSSKAFQVASCIGESTSAAGALCGACTIALPAYSPFGVNTPPAPTFALLMRVCMTTLSV